MSERKAGRYWVKYAERLVSFGATKEWVPLYWQGERFEDEHYFLEHQNIGEIGPRIPTPDEPWQCVPKEIHSHMLCAVGNHYGTDHEKAFEDAWDDAFLAAPKAEDV